MNMKDSAFNLYKRREYPRRKGAWINEGHAVYLCLLHHEDDDDDGDDRYGGCLPVNLE